MGVKTYQAYSMAESLAAAKRDLGPDAVILETRTFKRGGLLGVGRRSIFELTATDSDRSAVARPPAARTPQRAAAAVAYAGTTVEEKPDLARTRRLAQAMLEKHDRETRRSGSQTRHDLSITSRNVGSADPTYDPTHDPTYGPTKEAAATMTPSAARPQLAPVARRFILTPTEKSTDRHVRRATVSVAPALTGPESGAMQNELSAIKTMVGQVLQRQTQTRPASPPDMPQQLFDMYLEMIGQDLSEELADQIVTAARQELHEEQWDDTSLVRETLARHLSELVPVADPEIPIRSPDDRPLTIALIGPTGVGKTTTLAKLAASFKLRQHRRVGLVTCDTYRIAAVDQLRTYANIIGLPLEVALTPAEMRQAVHALRDCDAILIDTAGRGPNDHGRLDELHNCLDAVEPHEVHLVLSSTSSQRVLMREAEAFAALGADRLVLTKLDEAVSFGVLVNVMQAVGKKLSFITTGQEVPDHLEVGRPRRLADLVLGAPLHS
ncbi:MAG: flagellar biosynthesis protein FlhF [Planctomycetota bacterium]|jgi:flagellar biosynthesis protein FlhF